MVENQQGEYKRGMICFWEGRKNSKRKGSFGGVGCKARLAKSNISTRWLMIIKKHYTLANISMMRRRHLWMASLFSLLLHLSESAVLNVQRNSDCSHISYHHTPKPKEMEHVRNYRLKDYCWHVDKIWMLLECGRTWEYRVSFGSWKRHWNSLCHISFCKKKKKGNEA